MNTQDSGLRYHVLEYQGADPKFSEENHSVLIQPFTGFIRTIVIAHDQFSKPLTLIDHICTVWMFGDTQYLPNQLTHRP